MKALIKLLPLIISVLVSCQSNDWYVGDWTDGQEYFTLTKDRYINTEWNVDSPISIEKQKDGKIRIYVLDFANEGGGIESFYLADPQNKERLRSAGEGEEGGLDYFSEFQKKETSNSKSASASTIVAVYDYSWRPDFRDDIQYFEDFLRLIQKYSGYATTGSYLNNAYNKGMIKSVDFKNNGQKRYTISLTFDENTTVIPEGLFMDAPLVDVTIPNSFTEIESGAFARCTKLTSINLPKSITRIGGAAFEGCNGLTSVDLPKSVKEIGPYAFVRCTGLTSIVIPRSVKEIGEKAFFGCTNLMDIKVHTSNTKIGENAFPEILVDDGKKETVDDDDKGESFSKGKEDIQFRRVDDVFNYLSKHTFKSNNGITLSIRPSGISVSGRLATNAVRVSLNNEYSAIVLANTPVGETVRFIVNCSTGQIVDVNPGGYTYYEQ